MSTAVRFVQNGLTVQFVSRAANVRFNGCSMTQAQFNAGMNAWLAALPSYNSREEALEEIELNEPYLAGSGHVSAPEGTLLVLK